MKVTVAIDSFKGSLSTYEAADAAEEGIRRVFPDAQIAKCPLADGGEGTVRAIAHSLGASFRTATVTGPLGETVEAEYAYSESESTAILEMASAAGITLVPEEKRDPRYATTYGVGELIKHAITQHGCRKFIIGIGGSATNDGGVGMLAALGYAFLDENGKKIPGGAIGLSRLKEIDASEALEELAECEFRIACDVKNPLLGENGASRIFGPQKGATPEMTEELDGYLARYAAVSRELLGKDFSDYPGAGAAGGLGFAFVAYLGARLESGIDLVMSAAGVEEAISTSDVVITGEGRLDGQSCMGKAPVGVATLAKKYGKPVVAVSGAVTKDSVLVNQYGIDAFFPILRTPVTLSEAMEVERAYASLANTTEQIFRLIGVFQSK